MRPLSEMPFTYGGNGINIHPSFVGVEMEVWKVVSGFPNYEVSDGGLVRRAVGQGGEASGAVLKPRAGKKGHMYVNLFADGKSNSRYVHRIVLEAFVGPNPLDKPCCGHRDGNPSNNNLSNLRWVSYKENSIDSIIHGTSRRPGGESHFRAKLNAEKIRLARQLHADGKSFRSIAKQMGVTHGTISAAVSGRSYADA